MNSLRPGAVCALLLLATSAAAEPTQVFIGMHVVELRSVDVRAQSFYVDAYLWVRHKQGADEKVDEAIERIEPINGKLETKDVNDEKIVDGERYVCWRITGTFFFTPDLRKYPFDRQVLPLTFEPSAAESDELVFIDDRVSYEQGDTPEPRWGLSPTLEVPDYKLAEVKRLITESKYPTNFGDPSKNKAGTKYSRYSLQVSLTREYWSYAFKILVPLLIILAMAYLVFFLPAAQLDTSASVAMTALLSCMAYNVAVTQSMPEIGYLVLSDKFFIGTYVLLLLTLAQTFVTFVIDAEGNAALAKKIDLGSRWVFPLLVAGIFGIFMVGV